MNCPPTKRLRGLNQDVVTAVPFDDPFDDDGDFTQDDLDEIDIIASQAITSTALPGHEPRPSARGSAWSASAGPSRSVNRASNNQSRENTFGFSGSSRGKAGNHGAPSREPLSSRQQQQQQFGSDREDSYGQLEAQHAELKRKLKEVEDEILLKNGEIRVLRDSLKGVQQEKETQRQNQNLLETQRQREHSEREKELNRKVQSLQTELQFKEAEINEMKTKLTSDKNKTASPLRRNSPKVLSSLVQVHHGSGSSSPSPIGNGFITKEMFGATIPSRTTPVKTRREDRASGSRSGDRQEVTRPDPFLSIKAAHQQHRGGVLLGLLLQQPLSPSSLGLSHLLSMNLRDFQLMGSSSSGGFLLSASTSSAAAGAPGAAPTPVQSLAVTGLNQLSQSRPEASASSRNKRSCPGADLLLPLLDLHLSQLCQALDSLRSSSSGNGSSNSAAAVNSLPAGRAGAQRLEETGSAGFSVEDTGLAALRLLNLLLAHSDEVVEAVLSSESQSRETLKKAKRSAADVGPCSQNALLQSVLRLCEGGSGDGCSQREQLVLNAVKTLCVLIERSKDTHTDRLQCVLPVVSVCVSADSRLQIVSECVSVLTSMSEHQSLCEQLCLQHDPCVFLKLFLYIRNRPDDQAPNSDWILLDLQVVRLLSRLMTQRGTSWTSGQRSTCPCSSELVQTVVIVFHRQWLDLRGAQEQTDSTGVAPPSQQSPAPSPPWFRSPAASLLRECLLLLHWLLLHHSGFSESCRPLLHMYDQVIPAVRDTLRRIPELSESEELALEEICRSEGDDTDDMDTDTGS